jgi:hypothetical protein
VAVMRETVGLGIPVISVSSRLLTGASAAATQRSTASPLASAEISSVDDSRSFAAPAALIIVDTKTPHFSETKFHIYRNGTTNIESCMFYRQRIM